MGRAVAIVTLLFLSPIVLAAPSPGQPEVTNDICSTWEGGSGICDDYDSNDDLTPLDEWIESMIDVQVVSAEQVTLRISVAIHELSRSDLNLEDLDLQGDSTPSDGIPADYIRNYLQLFRSGQMVEDHLVDVVEERMQTYIEENFEYTTNTYLNTVSEIDFISQTDVSCTYDADIDSIDETAGLSNDAFNPPLCFEGVFELVLNPLKLGIHHDSTDFNRMMRGLLTMGGTMESSFTAVATPGHAVELAIFPPEFASASSVVPPAFLYNHLVDSTQQGYGVLYLDHRDATLGFGPRHEDLILRMVHREIESPSGSGTPTLSINSNIEPALDLNITIDARDSMNTEIVLQLGIHHLDSTTLGDWNAEFASGSLDIPWITSDGIRMLNEEIDEDLSILLNGLPLDNLSEGFSDVLGTEVRFSNPAFVEVDGQGGLEFRHDVNTCEESLEVRYCLEGSRAMSGDNPIFIESESQPAQVRISQILEPMMESNLGNVSTLDFSILTDEDLAAVMSIVDVEFGLGSNWLQEMLPENFPNTDISLTLLLPNWLHSTVGESDRILMESPFLGSNEANYGFEGKRKFDWQHPICVESIPCEDDSPDVVCTSSQSTCITSRIEIDLEQFRIRETAGAVEFDFSAEIILMIHRVTISVDEEGLELGTIPADLIRRAVAIGDRREGGLLNDSAMSARLDIGLGEPIDIEISNAGMVQLGETITERSAELFEKAELQNFPMDLGFGKYQMDFDLSATPFIAQPQTYEIPDSIEATDTIPFEVGALIKNARATVTGEGTDLDLRVGSAALLASINALMWPFGEPVFGENGLGFSEGEMKQKIMPIMEHTSIGTVRSSSLIIVHMPEYLRFSSFSTTTGFYKLEEGEDGQILTYLTPICPSAVSWAECEQNADTVRYNIEYGWNWIFIEIAPYLVALIGLLCVFGMRFYRRRKEGKEKRRLAEEEKDREDTEVAAVAEFGEMKEPVVMVDESFFE